MALHHSRLSATTMISLQQQCHALLTKHLADVAYMVVSYAHDGDLHREGESCVSAATAKYSPDLTAMAAAD